MAIRKERLKIGKTFFQIFNPQVKLFFWKKEVFLRSWLFLRFWINVPSHDAMNPPAVVFEWFQAWICTLTNVTAIWLSLFVGKKMFLQTFYSSKPAKTNRAAHRLYGGLTSPTPLVKQKTDCVWEVRVAVGAVIGFKWVWGLVCNSCTFASIPG